MAKWLEQASQWHEMYCNDLEVMSSNPSQVKLGVCSVSVLRCTWSKNSFFHWKKDMISSPYKQTIKFCGILRAYPVHKHLFVGHSSAGHLQVEVYYSLIFIYTILIHLKQKKKLIQRVIFNLLPFHQHYFYKIHKQKVVQFLFNVNHILSWFWRRFSTYFHEPHSFAYKKPMWFTYHTWNSKSFGFPTKLFSLWWPKWKWFIFHFKQARPNVVSPYISQHKKSARVLLKLLICRTHYKMIIDTINAPALNTLKTGLD